jgi:hypothetical protein
MSRPFPPKVVTANDLRLGDVVYLTPEGIWSRHHHEAELFSDEDRANTHLARAVAQNLIVVGAYLADARAGTHGPEPTHFREVFRTRGPSNYAHGKQVEV